MPPTPHLSRRGLLAAVAASAALPLLAPSVASARPVGEVRRAPYTFRNAEIVGGGFVTGIVFNQRESGLVYARTDIGGAYRLDTASRRWIPLTDWIGWDEYGHTGIISIATDEVDPDRVYLAAGTYTLPDWDPNMAAILRSTDRGRTQHAVGALPPAAEAQGYRSSGPLWCNGKVARGQRTERAHHP